jgi:DNA-binding response OmpR family regulator
VGRLLIVEDEAHLAEGLRLNFELEGHEVDLAATARRAEALLAERAYDVIVLDVMLPDQSGFELCQRLRGAGVFTPVIMLTARAAPDDRVRGLESGADDYLVKPFALEELLARVRSLLRRRRWERARGGESSAELLRFGEAVIDFQALEATVAGAPLRLTRLEFDLLRYFGVHAGRPLSRQELLENVWGLANYPNTRTVDTFVGRLRKLFEPSPAAPRFFHSVRGTGYRFDPEG